MDYGKYLREGFKAALQEGKNSQTFINNLNDAIASKDPEKINAVRSSIQSWIDEHGINDENVDKERVDFWNGLLSKADDAIKSLNTSGASETSESDSASVEPTDEKAKALENLKRIQAEIKANAAAGKDNTVLQAEFDAKKVEYTTKYNVSEEDLLKDLADTTDTTDTTAEANEEPSEDLAELYILAARELDAGKKAEIIGKINAVVVTDLMANTETISDVADYFNQELSAETDANSVIFKNINSAKVYRAAKINFDDAGENVTEEVRTAFSNATNAMGNDQKSLGVELNGLDKEHLEFLIKAITAASVPLDEKVAKEQEEIATVAKSIFEEKLASTNIIVSEKERFNGKTQQEIWRMGFVELARITNEVNMIQKAAKKIGIGNAGQNILTALTTTGTIMTTVGFIMTKIPGLAPYSGLVLAAGKIITGSCTATISGKQAIKSAKNGDWGAAFKYSLGVAGSAWMISSGVKGIQPSINNIKAKMDLDNLLRDPKGELAKGQKNLADLNEKSNQIDKVSELDKEIEQLKSDPNSQEVLNQKMAERDKIMSALEVSDANELPELKDKMTAAIEAQTQANNTFQYISEHPEDIKKYIADNPTALAQVKADINHNAEEMYKNKIEEDAGQKVMELSSDVENKTTEIVENPNGTVEEVPKELTQAEKYELIKKYAGNGGWYENAIKSDPENKAIYDDIRNMVNGNETLKKAEITRTDLLQNISGVENDKIAYEKATENIKFGNIFGKVRQLNHADELAKYGFGGTDGPAKLENAFKDYLLAGDTYSDAKLKGVFDKVVKANPDMVNPENIQVLKDLKSRYVVPGGNPDVFASIANKGTELRQQLLLNNKTVNTYIDSMIAAGNTAAN